MLHDVVLGFPSLPVTAKSAFYPHHLSPACLRLPFIVLTMCLLKRSIGEHGEGLATISKRSVDATKAGEKDAYLWDQELKGFGLKVTPAGRKVYLVQYRLGGRKGRTRRVTIGLHGVLTADDARTRAKQLLGEVAAGRDPAATLDEVRGSSGWASF